MKLSAIRQEASYVMTTQGLDEAQARFEELSKAQKDAAQSSELLTRQHTAQEKALTRTASKLEAMTRAHDTVSASGAKLARMEALIAAERARGATITDANLRALETLRIKHEAAIEATSKSTAHMNDNARAAGLARHEWINLSRQLQDVGVSLAGGASPFMVLTQQGGQIADVFSSSGAGAGAALKDFGGTVLRFALHPVTLLTAAIGTAAYAYDRFDAQQRAIERSLNGVGRAAGVTAEQLRGVGAAGAAAGGFGGAQGIDLAGRYASAGVRGGNIQSLVENTQRFARGFGVGLDDAAQEISQIVGDSSLGAMEKRFGAIDFTTKEMVRSLEQSGRYVEAQAAVVARLSEEIGKAKDTSSELEKIWAKIKTWATTPIFGLGPAIDRLTNGPSLQERLAAARGDLFFLRAKRGPNESAYPGEAAAAARVRDLERRIEDEREAARRAARDLETNRLSQDAAAAARRLSPESFEKRDLEGQQSLLRRALGDPETVRKMGDVAIGARAALAHLTTQIENWQSALEKQREDAALAVREIGARTYAEREAVAMERARVQMLRETGDVTRAAVAAESERAKLLAEAARKAEEYARQGRDQLALSALKPYERGRQQIINEAHGLREQFLPANAASRMANGFRAAGDAARSLADTLLAQAGRIGGAGKIPILASGESGADAAALLRRFEGFAPRAKFDVNAWRAGFGSDTVTRENGAVERISKDSVVSRADAERDLTRRVREVEGVIARQIGARAFEGLSPRARAALDSVAYNYGSLPGRLLPAARSGDDSAIASGIRGLAGDNRGVNARRRNAEADFILSGGANDNRASAIGSQIDEGLRSRLKAYDIEQINGPLRAANEEIERQRALLNAQAEAFRKSTEEVAKASKQQELLNQFEAQGVPITDQLRASIGAAAENYGRLAKETEDAANRQKEIVAAMDEVRSISREALGSLISDLVHGKSAAESLRDALGRMGDRLISSGLDRLVGGFFGEAGKAGGGVFGGLLSGLFAAFDEGGVVGAPGGRMVRAPLSAFVGAPHFASGGAVPVIAHAGEVILNAAQQANVAAAIKAARGAANSNTSSHNRGASTPIGPIVFNLPPGSDGRSFQQSEGQITAMMARAIANAQRYA